MGRPRAPGGGTAAHCEGGAYLGVGRRQHEEPEGEASKEDGHHDCGMRADPNNQAKGARGPLGPAARVSRLQHPSVTGSTAGSMQGGQPRGAGRSSEVVDESGAVVGVRCEEGNVGGHAEA